MLSLERAASGLFSTATFRPVIRGQRAVRAEGLLQIVRDGLRLPRDVSHLDVLEAAYASMTANYRSEYVYRNLITNRIFLGRHRASSGTAFLNEFRVGASVADCVLVNGHATVYEIKTELDRPGPRLQSQLDSYYRAFPLVNVVVHEAHVPRYVDALEGTAVGVLSVGRRWRLSVVRPAIERMDEFDTKVLFNLLRAGEVEQALHAWFGEIPDVPNGIRYREHFTLAQRIPPLRFQSLVHGQLRMRGYRGHPAAILSPRLKPLRALLVQLQPNVAQYRYLLDWLERAA